jgi:hypothetical protein
MERIKHPGRKVNVTVLAYESGGGRDHMVTQPEGLATRGQAHRWLEAEHSEPPWSTGGHQS